MVGSQPNIGAVDRHHAQLLRMHHGQRKIIEYALLNAEARKPDVGPAPQIAADLKHLGDLA